MKTKCTATLKCLISKIEMRQTGYGYEIACPICGNKYNSELKIERKSNTYKDIIKRKFT